MKTQLLFITILLGMGVFFQANSQSKYEIVYKKDKLEISGKWAHTKIFDETSPLELRLKIENTGDSAITFNYQISLYMDVLIKEQSEPEQFTIKAGKIKQGKLNGVRFLPATLTNDEIQSKDFSWQVSVDR